MPPLVRALRPEEWVKNLLVLAPLLSAQRLGDGGAVLAAAVTAVAFCAAASAAYLVNDVRDAELDRRHPLKRRRPVAAGTLGAAAALRAAAGLALVAMGLGAAAGVAALVAGYLALAVAYTFALKRVPVLDVVGLAGCFVLRPLAGAAAIGVPASAWLVACALALAGYLGFAKRRQELAAAGSGAPTRPALARYRLAWLDPLVAACGFAALGLYAVWASGSPGAGAATLVTVPPVAAALGRHAWLVYARRTAQPVARLVVRDPGLVAAAAAWALLALVTLR